MGGVDGRKKELAGEDTWHIYKNFQIPSVFSGIDLGISKNCFLLKKSIVFGREAQEKGHSKQRKGGGYTGRR